VLDDHLSQGSKNGKIVQWATTTKKKNHYFEMLEKLFPIPKLYLFLDLEQMCVPTIINSK